MVSILLSAHNAANELHGTLQSIAEQTYPGWELIAVDDASSDETLRMFHAFAAQYPQRVTVLRNAKNLGLTRSLIAAERVARGDCLARIDAGDTFHPKKLTQQIAFFDANPEYGIVGCNYTNVFLPSGRTRLSNIPLDDEAIRSSLIRKNPFAHSCVVMRRSCYRMAGGYNPSIRYGQDYDLWFRLLRTCRAVNLSANLCTRTMSERSLSYRKQCDQMLQCLHTQWRYMNRGNPRHYLAMLEPLSLVVLPDSIKRIFRA